jgi:hypothetical protein
MRLRGSVAAGDRPADPHQPAPDPETSRPNDAEPCLRRTRSCAFGYRPVSGQLSLNAEHVALVQELVDMVPDQFVIVHGRLLDTPSVRFADLPRVSH